MKETGKHAPTELIIKCNLARRSLAETESPGGEFFIEPEMLEEDIEQS